MQYKKKLTDIFLRKEQKSKKQIVPQKLKVLQFDESYFEAQLQSDNIHTTLMKVNAVVRKGANAGQKIPLKCRWYTKNQYDFKQIEDVKANFFQPCLQDVGNIICVQIEPNIEGMNYIGITIMKESEQLKMDKKLQNLTNEYFASKHLEMQGKIECMYSQNPMFEKYQFPLDVVMELRQSKVSFKQKSTKQVIMEYKIDEDFPQIDFNRKSFNSLLFTCNQNESMKLSISNNFNRDLFALIVRSIPSRLSIQSVEEQLSEFELSASMRSKNLIDTSQQTTRLILKLDELNKEIKSLKRSNEEITTNYHLERNAKINLQNEIEKLKSELEKINLQHTQCKPLHLKIRQVSQQNKYYFGEISLLKAELKQKTNTLKELKYEVSTLKTQKQALQQKIQQLATGPTTTILNLQQELHNTKNIHQQLQTQNESLKQKINELQNEKNLLRKKLSSIVSEKSLPVSPIKSPSKISSIEDMSSIKDSQTQIKQLIMQVTNLEMLLKHKSGERGGDLISMHCLINSLTQKIGQKQIEIESLKKINKQISKNVSGFTLTEIK